MDLDVKLLGRAIQRHGFDLVEKIKQEQQIDPPSSVLSYIDIRRPGESDEKNEQFFDVVRSFIARKSDMLFTPLVQEEEEEEAQNDDKKNDDNDIPDVYAIMPPLETFMNVPSSFRREHFYNSLSKEDCVTGVVTSLLETGLLVQLLCVDVGPPRDLDGLDVMAYCPAKELPKLYAKESALGAFQENDIVRGIVLSVNPETERIIISLHDKAVPQNQTYPRIGLITEEEFPVHYRRKSEAKNKAYEDILESVMGFNNVGNVKVLTQHQGFSEVQSYTRSLARLKIPQMEYVEGLNKWQSQKMAHLSVASGVAKFKESKYEEAMQHFNKALQIDTENVEALVARGALFANKENFQKAVADFKMALSINTTHANARNYLIETLLTMGKLLEDERRMDEACDHYQQALEVDPEHTEAKDILMECQKLMAFQQNADKGGKAAAPRDVKSATSGSESDTAVTQSRKAASGKSGSSPSILSKSTEKLLQLIKEDESKLGRSKKKGKHKRNTDRSSSSEKEEPKKKKKKGSSSSSDSELSSREKIKGKGKNLRSSSPAQKVTPVESQKVKIKDGGMAREESFLMSSSSRLRSPKATTSGASFLPFSRSFFNSSTVIPGLGSPPPNPEPSGEEKGQKGVTEVRLPSPGRASYLDNASQPKRRESCLMEQRTNFYTAERRKSISPSSRGKVRRRRSVSSSRSSSSSPYRERYRGRNRSRRSTSRGRSPSYSQAKVGAQPEKDAVKKRTGIAELDMYLGGGDRSSGKTIMALLGRGSLSGHHQKSRSPSWSPISKLGVKRRSGSRSPYSQRNRRSLSRSSGPSRRRRVGSRSPIGRPRRRTRSRSQDHDRPNLRRKSPLRSKPRETDQVQPRRSLSNREGEKSYKSEKGEAKAQQHRHNIDDPGRGSEKEAIQREWKIMLKGRGERSADASISSPKVVQRAAVKEDSHKSQEFEEDELVSDGNPKSKPYSNRLRGAVMDDPSLGRQMISSKQYDAVQRELRQKNEKAELKSKSEELDLDHDTTTTKGKKKKKSKDKEVDAEMGSKRGSKHKHRHHQSKKEKRDREKTDEDDDSDTLVEKRRTNDSKAKDFDKKGDDAKSMSILMAPEDLEKEIERRVLERLKKEEMKETKKKDSDQMVEGRNKEEDSLRRESSGSEAKDRKFERDDDLYKEIRGGWTIDTFGTNYFAIQGCTNRIGYTKDKFGKRYFVGPDSVNGKAGVNQVRYSRSRNVTTPSSPVATRRDTTQAKKRPSSGYVDMGREAKTPEDSKLGHYYLSDRRKFVEEEHKHNKDIKDSDCLEIRFQRPNDNAEPGASVEWNVATLKGNQSTGKEKTEEDGGSDSPPKVLSRWDQEVRPVGDEDKSKKRRSSESLTDLEKFLTDLKHMKKQQWISEGKIKEKN